MGPKDIAILVAVLLVIGGAVVYLYRQKKRGNRCVGCPYANACSKKVCEKTEEEK